MYPHLDYSFDPQSGKSHIFLVKDNHCDYYRSKKYDNQHKNYTVNDIYSKLIQEDIDNDRELMGKI